MFIFAGEPQVLIYRHAIFDFTSLPPKRWQVADNQPELADVWRVQELSNELLWLEKFAERSPLRKVCSGKIKFFARNKSFSAKQYIGMSYEFICGWGVKIYYI